jgi:C_GCAxxG_C_C family probable redox protein
MSDPVRLAAGRFARGFNCAQAVFSAFAEEAGVSNELALKLTAPLGAGMGRAGETCGALSGALLALGLRYGSDRPGGKEEMYRLARAFIEQFRAQHGTLLCRDLVGHDISTPEGLQAAREHNSFGTVCPAIVEQTARALASYMEDHPVA